MQHILPPKPLERAPLAQYLFDRGLKPRDVNGVLGCSHEQVRRVCLPVTDRQWRPASQKLRQKVAVWTGNVVGVNDWPERASKSDASAELAASLGTSFAQVTP